MQVPQAGKSIEYPTVDPRRLLVKNLFLQMLRTISE